jgi:hypothetical protein
MGQRDSCRMNAFGQIAPARDQHFNLTTPFCAGHPSVSHVLRASRIVQEAGVAVISSHECTAGFGSLILSRERGESSRKLPFKRSSSTPNLDNSPILCMTCSHNGAMLL